MYLFTSDKRVQDVMVEQTLSGSVSINEVVMHYAVESLPFGGVGHSGMGCYHGKYSFDTFTHQRSALIKNFNPLLESLASSRYPPYSDQKISFIQMMMKRRRGISVPYGPQLLSFLLGVAATWAFLHIRGRTSR
uniref:Aldehyde dehydrogenase domain-containing protein n=2 Tax=Homalodisca liturata TaxID=320908 RepID=A0A1B6HRP1_9HEMI